MLSIFVPDDGCTVTANIPGMPGLYPAVVVRYRPATPEVRAQYADALPREKLEIGCKLISRQVQELTVEGADQPVTLRPEQVRKLHAELYQSILFAVIGLTGPNVEENGRALFPPSVLPSAPPP